MDASSIVLGKIWVYLEEGKLHHIITFIIQKLFDTKNN